MARENCVNASMVLSFFVGGLIGVGVALLLVPGPGEIQARIKSTVGRREKLTREQVIEEGLQCAVPEGADMCYPGQGEEE
ncbi:MAG: YtxH domain-containing protein [Syntrophorhabdales bacterium]